MTLKPPCPLIARALAEGKVVPFLGAGASQSHRPRTGGWTPPPNACSFPPLGGELARHLAEYASYPDEDSADDLPGVSAYFEQVVGDRDGLRDMLREAFPAGGYRPGPLHHYLAAQPKPLLLLTTNYDDLLEQAMVAAGRDYHLLVRPADEPGLLHWYPPGASQPQEAAIKSFNQTPEKLGAPIIFKLHGGIDPHGKGRDSYLITEDDYVDYLAGMRGSAGIPPVLERLMRRHNLLFLGYGLRDWNFRVMFRCLLPESSAGDDERPRQSRRAWAITESPGLVEEEIWGHKRVKFFDMRIEAFVEQLRATSASPA